MRFAKFNLRIITQAAMMLLIGLVMLLLQGCIMFTTETHSVVYSGTVLDARTKLPVTKATVTLQSHLLLTSRARTDAKGNFVVGPLKSHDIYLWIPGPEPNRTKYDADIAPLSLKVAQAGYHLFQIRVEAPYATNVGSIFLWPSNARGCVKTPARGE
jgi:hypothetical protein